MKEKRYYCDYEYTKKRQRIFFRVCFIVFAIVSVISGLIYYHVMKHDYSEDYLQAYSERTNYYEYLNEIADDVIGKDGINIAAIPEDVVKYEITYRDGKIVFNYSLDNNYGKEFASMKVTLSKDFEVLSKEPNLSPVPNYELASYILPFLYGALTGLLVVVAGCSVILVAIQISEVHKKIDMKRKLS